MSVSFFLGVALLGELENRGEEGCKKLLDALDTVQPAEKAAIQTKEPKNIDAGN